MNPTKCLIKTHHNGKVTLVLSDVVMKRFHECPFSVEIGDKFPTTKEKQDRGNAFKQTRLV